MGSGGIIYPVGIGTIPDNSTNLYPDNLEKCYDGLCYVIMSARHLTTNLTVQKDAMDYLAGIS